MKFRTEIVPERADFTLSPELPVAMLGSCFADNMAARMRECLWKAINPLGVLYNPLSIEKTVRLLLLSGDDEREFSDSLFLSEGRYRSWLFDSKTSSEAADDCKCHFLEMRHELRECIKASGVLFVTFGTAWCYFLTENPDYVVANCHKQPSAMFIRRRITVGEIISAWSSLCNDLRKIFPGLRIVFTVSPVRHLKDGFSGNACSKAVLQLAVEEICRSIEGCSYFPAYEILNDDLRDYRFYASDLVHPSQEAVEYIWEMFKATYLDNDGLELLKEGERIRKAWNHRPLISSICTVTTDSDERERRRREEIKQRHESFLALHPGMLGLED